MGATSWGDLYRIRYTSVVDVSTMIRRCRREAGLSQQALADAASTSQPTIAAYESGRVVPSVPTLTRVLEACGQTLSVEPVTTTPRWTRVEEKSLALHRAIAARLLADPSSVLAHARRNLTRLRAADTGHGRQMIDAWDRLLDSPVDEIVTAMLARTQRGIDLRQMTPFAGVLSDDERREVLRSVPRGSLR